MDNVMRYKEDKVFDWEFNIEQAEKDCRDAIEILGEDATKDDIEDAVSDIVCAYIICSTDPFADMPDEFYDRCMTALHNRLGIEEEI